jgi:hypothetical protein
VTSAPMGSSGRSLAGGRGLALGWRASGTSRSTARTRGDAEPSTHRRASGRGGAAPTGSRLAFRRAAEVVAAGGAIHRCVILSAKPSDAANRWKNDARKHDKPVRYENHPSPLRSAETEQVQQPSRRVVRPPGILDCPGWRGGPERLGLTSRPSATHGPTVDPLPLCVPTSTRPYASSSAPTTPRHPGT